MRATEIVLPGVGEPDVLQVRVRDLPAPTAGQALVRVEASGVSFAEQQMRRDGYLGRPAFPFVPGHDLVGVVEALGAEASADDRLQVGRQVAALTRTGAWADRVLLDAADLVPLPDGVEPAEAETLVADGVTAWRLLHRAAKVRRGQVIVVLGANGGVGSTLVQLARHAGIQVIGTASARHHDAVRRLGAVPIDHRDDVLAKVLELAPEGVAAVFDHVGGPGIVDSWRMLARGGSLVCYGTAATSDAPGDPRLPVLRLLARLTVWNLLPNGRLAMFFDLWAGKGRRPERYRAELREDLGQVFAMLAKGEITAQVAATFPLAEAADALRHAESGDITGKVVLVP
ncbi:medium chain dehydrogenase/reductase family protein [Actinomadura sp. HBU206391]|uniref:medium chain dehydrogenase/reductase family protein n=1 Tax=Actinomadura sp. HBU206391 TaxID=2731692 RepID=UPI00165003E5|nr:medium chain dehydrogenase/reductase family protein [Actinomadura sp. HBU206391]MBC6461519.1 zinc-binding dehydrogenase [Actinomadura sp. HBU206391]